MLTTTEINSLSKKIEKTFTLSFISKFINKFVKKPEFKSMLQTVVGQKGDNTIKQGQAQELTAQLLNFKDMNTAMAITKEKESLSDNEICDKLDLLIEYFSNNNMSSYKKTLQCANYNFSNLAINELPKLLEIKNNIEKEKGSSEEHLTSEIIDLIKKCSNSKITSLSINTDESNEDYWESDFSFCFDNGETLFFEIEFITQNGTILFVENLRFKNGLVVEDNDFFDFIISLIDGIYNENIEKISELKISEEQKKQISLLLSTIGS